MGGAKASTMHELQVSYSNAYFNREPAKPLIVSHGLSNGTTVRDIRRLVREGKSMRREREDSLQQSTIIICDNAQSQVVMALFFMIDIS